MAGFNAPDVKSTAADSLFGGNNLFAPAKDATKQADDLFAALAPKEVALSAASQAAISAAGNAYQTATAAADATNSQANNLLRQQSEQISALNAQTEAYQKQQQQIQTETARQAAAYEKEKLEQAKAQAKAQAKQVDATIKALETDPTSVVGADLEAIFNSEDYKNMGTIQRRDWANLQVTALKAQVDKNFAAMVGLKELPKEPWSVEQQMAAPDLWKKVEKLMAASQTVETTLRAQVTARVNKEETDINAGSKWINDLGVSFRASRENTKLAPLADVAYKADTAIQKLYAGTPVSLWDLEDAVEVPASIRAKVTYAKRTAGNIRSEVREPLIDPKKLTLEERRALISAAMTQQARVVPQIDTVNQKAAAIREDFSDEQKNDTRNMSYENALWTIANPDAGWARKAGKGASLGVSYLNSNLVNSAPATAVAAVSAATAGAAVGAIGGGLPGAAVGAIGGLARLVAVSASALAVNPYIVSDYASSAISTFDGIPTEQLAKSVSGWDGYLAVAQGDPEVARKIFIASAVGKGVGQAKLLAAVSTLADPGTIAGVLAGSLVGRAAAGAVAGQSARGVARSLVGNVTLGGVARDTALAGLSTLGEAVEEGGTQYLANAPAFEAGILDDRWDGVAFAAGVGAALGGAMGGGVAVASSLGKTPGKLSSLRSNRTPTTPGYTPAQVQQIAQFKTDILGITSDLYTTPGAADTNTISSAFITALTAIEQDRPRQALYDSIVEDPIFKTMTTPEQRSEIQQLLGDRLGIKTNQFTLAGATNAQRAYGGDTSIVPDPITEAAINVRDGNAITNGVSERVAQAADALIAALDPDPNSLETTFERQADALVALGAARGAFNLNQEEFVELQNFAFNELNAKPERMTDAEVEQFNQVQAVRASQQAAGANGQNVGSPVGNAGTQSTGNNNAPQTPAGSNQAAPATGAGQSATGNSGQTVQQGATGQVQNPATPTSGPNGAPVQTGNNGQTNPAGQPVGQPSTVPTQAPVSGGSTGATPTGSNPNGQRPAASSTGQSPNSVATVVKRTPTKAAAAVLSPTEITALIAANIRGMVANGRFAIYQRRVVEAQGDVAGAYFRDNLQSYLEANFANQVTALENYMQIELLTSEFAETVASGEVDTSTEFSSLDIPSPDRRAFPGESILGTSDESTTIADYAVWLQSRATTIPDADHLGFVDKFNRGGEKTRAEQDRNWIAYQIAQAELTRRAEAKLAALGTPGNARLSDLANTWVNFDNQQGFLYVNSENGDIRFASSRGADVLLAEAGSTETVESLGITPMANVTAYSDMNSAMRDWYSRTEENAETILMSMVETANEAIASRQEQHEQDMAQLDADIRQEALGAEINADVEYELAVASELADIRSELYALGFTEQGATEYMGAMVEHLESGRPLNNPEMLGAPRNLQRTNLRAKQAAAQSELELAADIYEYVYAQTDFYEGQQAAVAFTMAEAVNTLIAMGSTPAEAVTEAQNIAQDMALYLGSRDPSADATVSDQTDTMRYGLPPNSEVVADATLGAIQNEQTQRQSELRSRNATPKPTGRRKRLTAKNRDTGQPSPTAENTTGSPTNETAVAPQQQAEPIQGGLDFDAAPEVTPEVAAEVTPEVAAESTPEVTPEVVSDTVVDTTNTEAVQQSMPFDAPTYTTQEVTAAINTLPEVDQRAITHFATGNGAANAEVRARLGLVPSTDAVSVSAATAVADAATVGLDTPAWNGVSNAFKKAIGKLLKALQSGIKSIAMVSLTTLALINADVLTTPAQAATPVVEIQTVIPSVSPDANAVRNYVAATNDSQGKSYLVADKKAGMLYMFSASGDKLTETSAIFGRDMSDSARSGSTPAGKFNLNYMPYEVSGYGGSVQAFAQQQSAANPSKGEIFAVHRVLNVPGQNRLGRLSSKTSADNRISDGCINVPAAFYDNTLDGTFSGPMYVIPETSTYSGNRFGTGADSDAVVQTKPALDTTPKVSSEQVNAATNFSNTETMKAEQPIAQPIVLEGTTPSSQVAMIEPIVTESGTATSAFVPEGQLTPAEQSIEPVFDTQGIDVEADGRSLYDVVGGIMGMLMGSAGLFMGVKALRGSNRRTSLRSNQANNNVPFMGPPQPFVGPIQPNTGPMNPASVASSPAQAQAIATAQAQQANAARQTRLEWYDYFNNVEDDPVPMETLTNLYWRVENAFTDNSLFDGLNTDNETRAWKLDKFGLMQKMLSGSGGATISLDEWARKVGAPRFGVEMDSSTISTKLARVKGMQSGALAILSKMGLKKTETLMQQVSDKTNYGLEKTETDIGDYTNLRHYNESGIDHFLGGFAYEVEQLSVMKATVEADIARRTAAGSSTSAEEAILKRVTKDLRAAQKTHVENITYVEGYDTARDFVNNAQAELAAAQTPLETAIAQEKITAANSMLSAVDTLETTQDTWLGTVRLPGGRTREQTVTRMAEIESEYDVADLTSVSDSIYAAVRSNVGYATANGVFTVEDLARFREVGLTNYVPAWSPKKDKAVLGDSSATEDFVDVTPIESLLAEPNYFKGLGLAPDITRFSRKGSLEAPADAMTNLRIQTTNLASRVAERQFTLEIEQLFEGSHYTEDANGQRVPVTGFVARQDLVRNLSDERLEDLANGVSQTPGIGRVKKGDPIPGGKSARIRAKGFDQNGEYRDYVYYFTDDMVQMDVERSLKNSAKPSNAFTKGVRRTTGMYAGLMTHLNVLWNLVAGVRTVGENAGNLYLRDLRDRDGNKLSEAKLQATFAKNNAMFAADMPGIASALINEEENTPTQRLLAEARRLGTLHIYSDVVNQKRERDMNSADKQGVTTKAKRLVSKVVRSNPVTRKGADVASDVWDVYSSGYVETVQIIPILATLQTALDLGVNPTEAHRVTRDMFDPQRNSQEWGALTTWYAFANSTKSGMYTTAKNLTQYGAKGPALLGIVAATTALMAAAIGQIEGDDEDGIPKNASDNISNSSRGIGVPMFGGKGFIPVGHGLNTVGATLGGIMYKAMHGKIAPGEAGKAIVGSLMDNLTPLQVASSKVMDDSVWSWLMLSLSPTLFQGGVETATNSVAYTGGRVQGYPTPVGQNAADRDNFYTPQVYKDIAKFSKYKLGWDLAPETLEHIMKRYAIGPAEIFPYMAEDIGSKTAGTMSTNSEEMGLWGILTGVTSFDPKFYDIRRRSYDISNRALKTQQKYEGISSTKIELVKQQLIEQGAPESDIALITNNITYQKEQKKLMKVFKAAVEKADTIEDRDSLEFTRAQADIQVRYAEMEQGMQSFMENNNEY